MFPPVAPDVRLLARLRDALARAGFTEAAVCERTGLTTLHDFPLGAPPPDTRLPEDAAGALILLFMHGSPLPRGRVLGLLGRELVDDLAALEMLVPGADPDAVAATVALYPIEGLYIVSDPGSEFPYGRADGVYPAINPSGLGYMAALPRTPCGSFLEVCSGTGIAALVAARTAGHAWASDIAERSTAFARLNAALNAVANFTAVQGDMYRPVAGRRFDRIVAHPPYVPALQVRQIYRDGGTDGEELIRRVLAEAPDHLLPGGTLYCTCVATERENGPIETCVREMLGPDSDDLDVVVIVAGWSPTITHFTREVVKGGLTLDEAQRLVRTFQELQVARFCSCALVVQKHVTAGPALTLRRERSGKGNFAAAVDTLLRWERFGRTPGALERLVEVRPRLSPRARLQVTHAPGDGSWALEACRVVVDEPLRSQLDASPRAAAFLAWCDGTRTLRDHVERLIAEGASAPDAPLDSFARLVLPLLQEGVLEAEVPPG